MRGRIYFALAFIVIVAAMVLTGCAPTPKPDPLISEHQVPTPVAQACPDARKPTDTTVPWTFADAKARIDKQPDAVAKVQLLWSWVPIWLERNAESDSQIAGCAKTPTH